MLRQIQYFHSVVENNSFSLAAEECNISQSAISQQIKALENELGFKLLERNNRKFTLTPAGEYFYKKTLILVSDYRKIVSDSYNIATNKNNTLKIGYLKDYSTDKLQNTVTEMILKYPKLSLDIKRENHEQLYKILRDSTVDIVFNDQRRAFSDEYVNHKLTTKSCYIEVAKSNPISKLNKVTLKELKNLPCILISSEIDSEAEETFYKQDIGVTSEMVFAKDKEDARIMVISGKGFLITENNQYKDDSLITKIPLYRDNEVIKRNYCVFWKKENSNIYVEEFVKILEKQLNEWFISNTYVTSLISYKYYLLFYINYQIDFSYK